VSGEIAKLVFDNYSKALSFGTKYIYQALPRMLTLWLDLGSEAEQPLDPAYDGL
jgi:serine/threonine-protein kinase ATR